jgi:hypothetical protein
MTVAHIGGVPVEEWLMPVLTTGSGIAFAVGATLRRLRRRA